MAESAAAAMIKPGASGVMREGEVFETGDLMVGDGGVPPQSAWEWRNRRAVGPGGSSGGSCDSSSGKSDVTTLLAPRNSPRDEVLGGVKVVVSTGRILMIQKLNLNCLTYGD